MEAAFGGPAGAHRLRAGIAGASTALVAACPQRNPYDGSRQSSQEVCPFNVRFAEEAAESGYAARGAGELPHGVEGLPGERAVEGGERGRLGAGWERFS